MTQQNSHIKTINCLIYEIGYINDAIIIGDFLSAKHAIKSADRKIEECKTALRKDGINIFFFLVSETYGNQLALSYEYKLPNGELMVCTRCVPRGPTSNR